MSEKLFPRRSPAEIAAELCRSCAWEEAGDPFGTAHKAAYYLFQELIERIGVDAARRILMHFGKGRVGRRGCVRVARLVVVGEENPRRPHGAARRRARDIRRDIPMKSESQPRAPAARAKLEQADKVLAELSADVALLALGSAEGAPGAEKALAAHRTKIEAAER
jgi:hypothetical protein